MIARSTTIRHKEGSRMKINAVALFDHSVETGGFTWDARVGEHVTRGIAVAVPGYQMKVPGPAATSAMIAAYADSLGTIMFLRTDYKLGGWWHMGNLVLDMTQVFPPDSLAWAIEEGRNRGQHSVYDLESGIEYLCSTGLPVGEFEKTDVGSPV